MIRKRFRRNLLIVMVIGMTLVVCVSSVTWLQGSVSGSEFSPRNFQAREFHYWEIPLVHLQVSPIKRHGSGSVLTRYLTSARLIDSKSENSTRSQDLTNDPWHLVRWSRSGRLISQADAELLVSHLEGPLADQWHQWSKDHPEQAKVLWSVVQRLALRELYVLIPDLFVLAQSSQQPAELAANLARFIEIRVAEIAADLHETGNSGLADQLLSEADEIQRDLRRVR